MAFQGHVHQERGALDEAQRAFERAVALFRAVFDRRHAAIFSGYLAGVLHERGDLTSACEAYARAAAELEALGGARFEDLFRACLGAALAEQGALAEAHRSFALAADLLDRVADPALLLALAIHRLHVDLAAPGGPRAPSPERRARREPAARRRLRTTSASRSASSTAPKAARSPRRLDRSPLRIDREARWFEPPGGARVSLARKRSLRLLLGALASARLRSPSRALDSAALLALGWPGDRVLPAAGAHRVRVAIATLRRLGLREHLVSRDDGYLLDPGAAVELARDEN